VAFVRVAAQRLELEREDLDVVLGGGLLQQAAPALVAAIAHGVHATAPKASIRPTAAPAILGSALLALDDLGAADEAKARLRRELDEAAHVSTGGRDG
jgi:hypothetical protein